MKTKAEIEEEMRVQVCMSYLIPVGEDIDEDSLLHEVAKSVSAYYNDKDPGDRGIAWVEDASDAFDDPAYGRVMLVNIIVRGRRLYPMRPLHNVMQCMKGIHEHLKNDWGAPEWSDLVYVCKADVFVDENGNDKESKS